MQPVNDRGLLLAEGWLPGKTAKEVKNPANGTVVANYSPASVSDVEKAVQEANLVGQSWSKMSAYDRATVLKRAAERIREEVDEIARVLTLEQGKPLPDSRKEILFGASVFEYYAEESLRVFGSIRPGASSQTLSFVTYEPVGVVAGIVPWNYPVDLYAWKVAPALAAGCPVIVKPPEEAPLAIGIVSGILRESGVPAGALADLPGGVEVGSALVASAGVSMVTATCSTTTGKSIMRSAAESLTRVSLELGGQCPMVVLPDADLQLAAEQAARRSFSNMGQICIAVNRVIVHESVADEFCDRLAAVVSGYSLGDPSADGVAYGPCTTEAVVQRSQEHVADALNAGAVTISGGSRPLGAEYSNGYYFSPTVLDHVSRGSKVMREESFGPVLAVYRASTVDEAIEVANDTEYGLAAYVFGEDIGQALAVAEQIDAGGVGVNVNDVSELQSPFGGRKHSGIGRELGPEGLMAFLESKHTKIRKPSIN